MAIITGEQIRRIREQIGLTQAQLGEKLDVSANTVARWERGEIEPEHPRMLWCALQYIRGQSPNPKAAAELAVMHSELMKRINRRD